MSIQILRLGPGDSALAEQLFAVMAVAFEEEAGELGPGYVSALLADGSFWVYAALADDEIAGGLTAHVLPMTRARENELMIYDFAVRKENQRTGVGRALLTQVVSDAAAGGIASVFVSAENVDEHALAFYQALGGEADPCTIFTFGTAASGTGSFDTAAPGSTPGAGQ